MPTASKPQTTTTCLINNYNYGRFVVEAVDSALAQTTAFDQIIVVDDGSTDDSIAQLHRAFGGHARVEIISKHNAGQLSCFNAGAERVTGDVVFFLDADDAYEPQHVERTLAAYHAESRPDFVFCGYREFGERSSVVRKWPTNRDLGYSVVLAAYQREWIGAKTSCLSMRRTVLNKILPLPLAEDWKTRADDCLIFGASLAGARKYYLAEPLIRYRVHGGNAFCRNKPDEHATYRRRLAINRLFEHLERKLSYNVARLGDFHHREFLTIAEPTFRELTKYLGITASTRLSPLRQGGCVLEMARHYFASRWRNRGRASATPAHPSQRELTFDAVETPTRWDEAPRSDSSQAAA